VNGDLDDDAAPLRPIRRNAADFQTRPGLYAAPQQRLPQTPTVRRHPPPGRVHPQPDARSQPQRLPGNRGPAEAKGVMLIITIE
jgi:hypothetical protein